MTQSVLVLDQVAQTLAVVRSLGRAGYRVVVGRSERASESEWSRHCREVWTHPPVEDAAGFADALRELLARRPDIRCVFPVGERSGAALAAMRAELPGDVDVAMVPPHLFTACGDKSRANELALRAGLLVPETRTATALPELVECAADIGFPIIVKPVHSVAGIFGRKVCLVESRERFDAVFTAWPAGHTALVVQRYVVGVLEAADFVARQGVIVGYFESRSVRTDMLDGTGFAVDFLSRPITPDVFAACRAFVRATEYSGAGLLQFIRSSADGTLYFVENNPRLSAGIAQTIACGVDAPLLTLHATARQPSVGTPEVRGDCTPYVVGDRTHWLQRDVTGWLGRRRELTAVQRREWLRQLLRSFVRADRQMNWDWRDPMPSVHIYLMLARRLIANALLRATGRRSTA